MSFGAKLKNCRKNMSLSQKELGQKIGVAESTVSLYESNKRFPDAETLKKISALFNVSIDYLLGSSLEETSPTQTEPIGYYSDPETAEMAEKLRTDPDMKVLFSAAKDLTSEEMQQAADYVNYLKMKGRNK